MNAEIKPNSKTKIILQVMNVVAWLAFVGLCIKGGALAVSLLVGIFGSEETAKKLYMGLNMSELYAFSPVQYILLGITIFAITAFKAQIFYLLIRIFSKINLVNPFSKEVSDLITGISYIALTIGIATEVAQNHIKWMTKQGVAFPDLSDYVGGGSEFIFFAGVVFFIAQIFKRGIELQSENELTV